MACSGREGHASVDVLPTTTCNILDGIRSARMCYCGDYLGTFHCPTDRHTDVHVAVSNDRFISAFVPVVYPPHAEIPQPQICLNEALIYQVALPLWHPCGCTGCFELTRVADDVAEGGIEGLSALFAEFIHLYLRKLALLLLVDVHTRFPPPHEVDHVLSTWGLAVPDCYESVC